MLRPSKRDRRERFVICRKAARRGPGWIASSEPFRSEVQAVSRRMAPEMHLPRPPLQATPPHARMICASPPSPHHRPTLHPPSQDRHPSHSRGRQIPPRRSSLSLLPSLPSRTHLPSPWIVPQLGCFVLLSSRFLTMMGIALKIFKAGVTTEQ